MVYHTPSPVVVIPADTQSTVQQVRGHSIPRIQTVVQKISQSGGGAPHVGQIAHALGRGGAGYLYIHSYIKVYK